MVRVWFLWPQSSHMNTNILPEYIIFTAKNTHRLQSCIYVKYVSMYYVFRRSKIHRTYNTTYSNILSGNRDQIHYIFHKTLQTLKFRFIGGVLYTVSYCLPWLNQWKTQLWEGETGSSEKWLSLESGMDGKVMERNPNLYATPTTKHERHGAVGHR